MIDAIRAVETAGIGSRDDFYWTLHSVFVKKREHRALFHAAFELFWRQRGLIEKMIAMLSPVAPPKPGEKEKPQAGRDARPRGARPRPPRTDDKQPELEIDAQLTVSAREVLQRKDFAQMTSAEIAEAKRALAALVLPDDRLQDAAAEARGAWPHRSAPHHARVAESRRRHHHAGVPRARRNCRRRSSASATSPAR